MKVIFDPKEKIKESTSATIGIFDGVHLGHKSIISLIRKEAVKNNLTSCVVTFFPHPQKVLRGVDMPLIVPLKERFRLLEKEGVDITVCFNFTKAFSKISAKDFIKEYLMEKINIKSIFVGPDLFFGRNREGNVELLESMGTSFGFETKTVRPVYFEDELISSTAIRQFIEDGNVNKAAISLGDCFTVEGVVKEGERRGRDLGFPTANLDTDWELLPKKGVYITWAEINGKKLKSITNVGTRPTFGKNQLLIETHILDFNDDIYGDTIRVSFIDRLRDEKRFDNVESLISQISTDVEKAKRVFAELSKNM
ncbi:MAG: bifunctional riboflavin kinase/FAD synthetase [Deltaproteobacteria bacterium]|nr:bifunctional riboflavin kinase/FAD synthetase [Deltaproteobacteria bacterium]